MLKRLLIALTVLIFLCSSAFAVTYTTGDGKSVLLSVGGSFVYARDSDGVMRVWGDNQFGQLGKGTTSQTFKIAQFKTKNKNIDIDAIQDVITASDYSFLLMDDSTLFGVGNNSYLSLACKEGNYSTHVAVNVPEKPVQLATGFGHVLLLTENGEVYAWGRNGSGQVGNGKTRNVQTPYKLDLQNIVQIAAGGKYSLALDKDGVLWGWGENQYSVLMTGDTENRNLPVRIDYGDIDIKLVEALGDAVVLLDTDGNLWTWGRNHMQQLGYDTKLKTTSVPGKVPLPLPVADVACYSCQTYAILTDGSLWSWGNNSYGQLGHGLRSSATEGLLPAQAIDRDVVLVMGGSLFAVAMLRDGTLVSAGISKFGQLGAGNDKSSYSFKANGMNLLNPIN